MTREESIIGCLLGTAVGDALGLSCEGLSRRRQQRMFGPVRGYHFLLGRGMISDDTGHTCLVAQSLIVSAGDERKFSKDLARRLLAAGAAGMRRLRDAGSQRQGRAEDVPELLPKLDLAALHARHEERKAELAKKFGNPVPTALDLRVLAQRIEDYLERELGG